MSISYPIIVIIANPDNKDREEPDKLFFEEEIEEEDLSVHVF